MVTIKGFTQQNVQFQKVIRNSEGVGVSKAKISKGENEGNLKFWKG